MCESYEILSDSAIEFEQASIKWKYISGCLGIIGTIINIFQLIILISWQGYKKFPVISKINFHIFHSFSWFYTFSFHFHVSSYRSY